MTSAKLAAPSPSPLRSLAGPELVRAPTNAGAKLAALVISMKERAVQQKQALEQKRKAAAE